MKNRHLPVLGLVLSLACSPLLAGTCDSFFADAGIRIGIDAEDNVDLSSYEIFATSEPIWAWQLTDSLNLDLGIETALGALTGEGETAVYARLAPVLELSFGDFPVSLSISSGPSLYSEDTFGPRDLGGEFQFTSGIGLNWQTCENWTLGYRFQHTSNADLNEPNPGLEMHTISLSRAF